MVQDTCLTHGGGCYRIGDILGYLVGLVDLMLEERKGKFPVSDPVAARTIVMLLGAFATVIELLELLEEADNTIAVLYSKNQQLQVLQDLARKRMH